tara:strand:- start:37 stop:411 length:375 start_codon:yes stop_codon:yes gene_type:complete
MNKITKLVMIDYLSLILVLSYLLFYNIYAVFIGIALAMFSIKILFISNLKKQILIKIRSFKKSRKDIVNGEVRTLKVESITTDTPSLVEFIEESGFIPSVNKEDQSNAASIFLKNMCFYSNRKS